MNGGQCDGISETFMVFGDDLIFSGPNAETLNIGQK